MLVFVENDRRLPFFWGIFDGNNFVFKITIFVALSTLLWLRRAIASISSRWCYANWAISSVGNAHDVWLALVQVDNGPSLTGPFSGPGTKWDPACSLWTISSTKTWSWKRQPQPGAWYGIRNTGHMFHDTARMISCHFALNHCHSG